MDGFSIRTTLARRRPWPRVAAVGLLLAGALPLLWPWSVRTRHQQALLGERTAVVDQARGELELAEEALRQAWDQPSVVDLYNARPDRFSLMELRVYAREAAEPPYPAGRLELARWCDQWEGEGSTCERGGERLTKAEAAIIVAAHELGEVPSPSLSAFLAFEEKAARRDARESLDDAEDALQARIEPAAGAIGRWTGTLFVLVAFAFAAFRAWRFHPGVVIEVDQHGVRCGDSHVPVNEILTCVARDRVIRIGTADESFVWGPFAGDRADLEKVARQIRDVMLTPQQRAAEERAERKIDHWHGAVEERTRD